MQKKEKPTFGQQIREFFPGIFEDEVWQAVGRGISRFCRYIYREPSLMRAAFLLISALILLRIYTGSDISIYELSATPDETPTVMAHTTLYDPDDPYGVWKDQEIVLPENGYHYSRVHQLLGQLKFRRCASEPFARLKAPEPVSMKDLQEGDIVLYLELRDDEGVPFFALQYQPDDSWPTKCGYWKNGLGISEGELLQVRLTEGDLSELAAYLYELGDEINNKM